MAVYLITLHAYRSWMPDHQRGYVRRGQGIQRPDAKRGRWYHSLATHERMMFSDEAGELLIPAIRELCDEQGWRLHGVVVVWTHIHMMVSWKFFRDAKRVRALVKRRITTTLRDHTGEQRKWLAGAGSVKRVYDMKHFGHLMRTYLPAHRRYGGRQWYEDV